MSALQTEEKAWASRPWSLQKEADRPTPGFSWVRSASDSCPTELYDKCVLEATPAAVICHSSNRHQHMPLPLGPRAWLLEALRPMRHRDCPLLPSTFLKVGRWARVLSSLSIGMSLYIPTFSPLCQPLLRPP